MQGSRNFNIATVGGNKGDGENFVNQPDKAVTCEGKKIYRGTVNYILPG